MGFENMLGIKISSLKRKIRTTNDLSPFIEPMLKNWNEWPVELYFEIKNRLLNGYMLEETNYAKIVSVSRSRTLYEARGFCSMSSLHCLLEAGIPDYSIELKICENVEKEFYARYTTHFNESLCALASYGSLGALEILEIIAYDNASAHQVSKLKENLWNEIDFEVSTNQDYTIQFERISSGLRFKYYNNLVETIAKIKDRNLSPEERFMSWSTI